MKRKVALVFIVLLLGLVAAFSRPTCHSPAPAELHWKARYLERIIRMPEGDASEWKP